MARLWSGARASEDFRYNFLKSPDSASMVEKVASPPVYSSPSSKTICHYSSDLYDYCHSQSREYLAHGII